MRVKGESDRQRIARIMQRCWKPVRWERHVFWYDRHKMQSESGETRFYEAGQIDNGARRMNRVQRVLSNSMAKVDAPADQAHNAGAASPIDAA